MNELLTYLVNAQDLAFDHMIQARDVANSESGVSPDTRAEALSDMMRNRGAFLQLRGMIEMHRLSYSRNPMDLLNL